MWKERGEWFCLTKPKVIRKPHLVASQCSAFIHQSSSSYIGAFLMGVGICSRTETEGLEEWDSQGLSRTQVLVQGMWDFPSAFTLAGALTMEGWIEKNLWIKKRSKYIWAFEISPFSLYICSSLLILYVDFICRSFLIPLSPNVFDGCHNFGWRWSIFMIEFIKGQNEKRFQMF